MNFASDNVAGAAPEILAALARAAEGTASSYGADPYTARLEAALAELFETKVAAFPVATGTAANSLALASICPPWGAVYAHESSHVMVDECGAPEMYTAGAKLVGLPGADGKITAADLDRAAGRWPRGAVHHVQAAAVSLTQATEAGTCYRPDEVAVISEVARHHGMRVHMDGARFANAVAWLGRSPADVTWRAGVDVLSFGATKNGALAAEVVVFFKPELAAEFQFRRKRAGHLFSKMRFLSAQLDAYLADGLWLRLARHANLMAARLAEGLAAIPGVRLAYPVEANEVFAELPERMIEGLQARGFVFYRWEGRVVRLVTAFNTEAGSVDALLDAARSMAPNDDGRAAG
ncbi:MAG TPA: low specificity L-threonine aldolase [Azospirillaceae bacterium]|nr:low specificity L-threonine aldolase [Azospirillaceae bacterium]